MRFLVLAFLELFTGLYFLPLLAVAQDRAETAAQSTVAKEFRAYLDADWKRWMELYPELATGIGYPVQNRREPDDSPQGIKASKAHLAASLKKLQTISTDSL